MEDGVNDAAYAISVCKTTHGPCSASDFTECTFDNVCGANLSTDKFAVLFFDRDLQEGQETIQVLFDQLDDFRIRFVPMSAQVFKGGDSFAVGRCVVNSLSLQFKGFDVFLFQMFGAVAQFMNPAALMFGVGINQIDGVNESFGAVGDDEFEVLTVNSAFEQIVQEAFTGAVGFSVGDSKADEFFLAEDGDAIGDKDENFLGFERSFDADSNAV